MFEPHTFAVAQTIAAHRLEGWAPTDEHIAALRALARDDASFPEYLATFRARHPAPTAQRQRPRLRLRRAVPYLIPGTTLLHNNFGTDSASTLAELEYLATAGRMVTWLRALASGERPDPADVQMMHRHLFADVYPWAGELRTTELRRGDHGFAWRSALPTGLNRLRVTVGEMVELGADQGDARLAYGLARLYTDYNHLHPFREGNGRAGALLLHAVVARCGRALDLAEVTREEWYAAAADSMPFRRDSRASHRPFLYVLSKVL